MQTAALTMESSRSTATTGAMITEVTQRTSATRTVKVWPGPQGGRGEREDQALLTGLLFPLKAWEYPQRDSPRSPFHPAFHAMEIILAPMLQMSKLRLIEPVLNARLVALKAQL